MWNFGPILLSEILSMSPPRNGLISVDDSVALASSQGVICSTASMPHHRVTALRVPLVGRSVGTSTDGGGPGWDVKSS